MSAQLLATRAGVSRRTAVARIRRTFERADAATLEAGAQWYGAAFELAREVGAAADVDTVNAAAAIAHLSPRQTWRQNARNARELAAGEPLTGGVFSAQVTRATRALYAADPWVTFGADAHKTRAFAHNILGEEEWVTVDSWAARVVGIESPKILERAGVYAFVADTYRGAARVLGVSPAVVQATTWIAIRGKAQ